MGLVTMLSGPAGGFRRGGGEPGGPSPLIFNGPIYFDSVSQPYGQPLDDGLASRSYTISNAGWKAWPASGGTVWYGPNSGTPGKIALATTNGFTPNQFGDRAFSWKYIPDQNNTLEGGIGFTYPAENGLYFDKANGFRAAVCVRKADRNENYDMHHFAIGCSADGYYEPSAGIRIPNTYFKTNIWARNRTPDTSVTYEVIDNTVLTAGTQVNFPGGGWDGDCEDWVVIGMQVPPNMVGDIQVRFYVPGAAAQQVNTAARTIVGDWSGKTFDWIGYQMWRRSTYSASTEIAWMWIGAIDEDWPA